MIHKVLKTIGSIKSFVIAHKVIGVIGAIVILYGGYWGYAKLTGTSAQTRYVLGTVTRGTLIASITGSGQVSALNQVDIKSKVSGDVLWARALSGSEVFAGQLLVQLNDRDAQKSVRDAEANLESAKIALEKLKGPEGSEVPRNKLQAQEDLKKAYDDGFNNIADVFLDLPTVMSGLENILTGRDVSFGGGNQENIDYFASAVLPYGADVLVFRDDASAKYRDARREYDKNFADYKAAGRFSSNETTETLLENTYATTKIVAESIKSANNLIQIYQDRLIKNNAAPAVLSKTYLADLNTYTATTNKYLLSLLSVKNTIKNAKDALLNADLDIRSQELSYKRSENALLDAKEKLADYYIRAPFSGTIAKINVKKSDFIGSGLSVGTLITKQKFAEISLNEVDIAKIKTGQKATVTFDAVPDLSVAGEVSEVDSIGTVSQGVVTYVLKITFDTQDERVKPGMSVTAAIVTDVKTDVLMVPNSAIKSQRDVQYVEMFDSVLPDRGAQGVTSPVPPRQQNVEIGLSNDNFTEILSGLKEGDRIVSRTITATTLAVSAAPSIFGATGGGNRGGAGAVLRGR